MVLVKKIWISNMYYIPFSLIHTTRVDPTSYFITIIFTYLGIYWAIFSLCIHNFWILKPIHFTCFITIDIVYS
jgi:hypothetical protein